MHRRAVKALSALLLAGCGVRGETRQETFAIPGTPIRMAMAYVPGESGVPPFWIATREVTWGEFDRFYEFPGEQKVDGVTRPSAGKPYLSLSGLPTDFLDAARPVTNVRYHSAAAYAEWLSKKSGAVYRLPTEKEWRLACGPPGGEAWCRDNSDEQTHPPGGKPPNLLGLHDILGNVWEYGLESSVAMGFDPVLLGGAWNSPAGGRITAPADWSEADPSRPCSTWWFRADHSQGFRLVRVPDTEGWEAYAGKIEIGKLAGREVPLKVGSVTSLFARVTGEVRNGGDRPLVELAIKVYFLDPKGNPHLQDITGGSTQPATYGYCFAALASSAHPGDHVRPLQPGERRSFTVDVPMSFDGPDDVNVTSFGASVLYARFGR